jgi:hypothetical protein
MQNTGIFCWKNFRHFVKNIVEKITFCNKFPVLGEILSKTEIFLFKNHQKTPQSPTM